MSVKNTLDGSFEIGTSSGIVNINLTYPNLTAGSYQSMYTKIGNMCLLYLPSLTDSFVFTNPSTINFIVPTEITPTVSQNIHGFSVNDADGTQNSMLQIDANSTTLILGKESSGGSPLGYNNTGPVSITRYRYILYQVNE